MEKEIIKKFIEWAEENGDPPYGAGDYIHPWWREQMDSMLERYLESKEMKKK